MTLEGWEAVGGAPHPIAFGLDVTERAKLTPAHLERLAEAVGCGDDPLMAFVVDATRFYFEFHRQYDGFYGAFIHDALVLAAALDPDLARTEALTVEVELEGRWTTGETVTDWRRAWAREPNLEIAVEADTDVFFDRFIERVGTFARDDASARRTREGASFGRLRPDRQSAEANPSSRASRNSGICHSCSVTIRAPLRERWRWSRCHGGSHASPYSGISTISTSAAAARLA